MFSALAGADMPVCKGGARAAEIHMLLPRNRAPQAALFANNRSAFLSCLPFSAKSAMAEILVSDLCDRSPAAAHRRAFSLPLGRHVDARAEPSHPTWWRLTASAVARLAASNRASALARISDRSDCSSHCFFYCFPLFPRRRLFPRPRKALHCNWRVFSIADRLYF
jgi:hypothetical protein